PVARVVLCARGGAAPAVEPAVPGERDAGRGAAVPVAGAGEEPLVPAGGVLHVGADLRGAAGGVPGQPGSGGVVLRGAGAGAGGGAGGDPGPEPDAARPAAVREGVVHDDGAVDA